MPTFAERYCAQHRCAPADFHRQVFWRSLHWHALPLVPLLGRDYFQSDRSLIDACARATSIEQVRDEIQIHPIHAHHGRWLHRHAKLRISRRRLLELARDYLTSRPSPGGLTPAR